MNLIDLQVTVELLVEASQNEKGARDRICKKWNIHKSVVGDRVRRIEEFFDVKFMGGPQLKTPTASGRFMAKYGPRLMDEIANFAELVREEVGKEENHLPR